MGDELVAIVAVALIFGTGLVAVLGSIFVSALKVLKGGPAKDKKLDASETKLIQNINQGLARMEERVEALETILLELNTKEQ